MAATIITTIQHNKDALSLSLVELGQQVEPSYEQEVNSHQSLIAHGENILRIITEIKNPLYQMAAWALGKAISIHETGDGVDFQFEGFQFTYKAENLYVFPLGLSSPVSHIKTVPGISELSSWRLQEIVQSILTENQSPTPPP